jgi:hypothetical protein
MLATCHDEELHAMALARSSEGTRLGISDWAAGLRKARAIPNRTRSKKIAPMPIEPVAVRISNVAMTAASTSWQITMTTRRL